MGKGNILREYATSLLRRLFPLWVLAFPLAFPSVVHGAGSLCAEVKIEIAQELTLERQAFDAHMRINNGLSHITLENIAVEVSFTNGEGGVVSASSDPNNPDALFFIRLDSTQNISAVNGSGTIGPSASADIHWLIIPAPGASNGSAQGTLYNVGARLTYSIGGEEHVTQVTPDYILVKPMPQLAVDYFLPADVYGDDAFTPETEPPIPFSLGVRVRNNGFGVARALQIDSAQPRIVENEQGLLVGFVIEGCEVNGRASANSLLARFGDIAPGGTGLARWIMTCTLSGRFVAFEAGFSHSDELGGELTSLLDAAGTHFLVRDVLVDLPGRDAVRDFLAKDGDIYRVYESDSGAVDTLAQDVSASSSLNGSGALRTLTTPVNAGFIYARLPDPYNGQKRIKEVTRSDGKWVKSENVWLSKTRNGSQGWNHFVNLFDANGTGAYNIAFEDATGAAHAPVLQQIPDRTVLEEHDISFVAVATDQDGTIPSLSAAPLPAGASFADRGDGTALFHWAPAAGQAGEYGIIITASDGPLEDTLRVVLTVTSGEDADGDGMSDAWEMTHFEGLGRDGNGDFDGDGISDLDEFSKGTDPNVPNQGPSAPEIEAPQSGAEVLAFQPALTIRNSTDPDGDLLTYEFELYSDAEMTDLVVSEAEVEEGVETTSWPLSMPLGDNSRYFWRVRAYDGTLFSLWTYGVFFVNTENDPPGDFLQSHPSDQAETVTLTPFLQITNSVDEDQDGITYIFEVYGDEAMATPVAFSSLIPQGRDGTTAWVVEPPLSDETRYFWRAVAIDEHGATMETQLSEFLVNTSNRAPGVPEIVSPGVEAMWGFQEADLVVANTVDPDGDAVFYYFELDRVDTFDSGARIASGERQEGDGVTSWHVTDLLENTHYYWRVKAWDGKAESVWRVGSFLVSGTNDWPSTPTPNNPGNQAWVDTPTPVLVLNPAMDPEGQAIIYHLEVYADSALTTLLTHGSWQTPRWTVPFPLADSTWHYWRARAEDAQGLTSAWTGTIPFFVKDNGVDDPPGINLLVPSEDLLTNGETIEIRWADRDPDSNALISLYYDTDNHGEDGALIAGGLEEDHDDVADSYDWDVRNIPDGTYYVYGVISDGTTTAANYSEGSVTLDRAAPEIEASPAGGSYTGALAVTLSTDEPAGLYYTIDGTAPTKGSLLYTGPLSIGETTTLRVVAVDAAGNQSEIFTETYTIVEAPADIRLSVWTDKARALPGVKVYAFKASGAYTGKSATTDQGGLAVFDPALFAAGNYKFRVDYLGNQFWSQMISIPGSSGTTVTIGEETAEVAVTMGSGQASGVKVYLFSQSGVYLGLNQTTDTDGRVSFVLPTGISYKFRADILGSQYWSEVTPIAGGGVNSINLAAGGGLFFVTVGETLNLPMAGIRVYLFSIGGTYLGRSQVTDASGRAGFDVSEGNYKVRADHLGYQFWSEGTEVTTDTHMVLPIPHQDVRISIRGRFLEAKDPLVGIKVYVFNSAGTYLSQYRMTDADGQVVFRLPDQGYKVRADYLNRQYWTEPFTWDEQAIEIAMGDAEITLTGGGFPMADQPVYVSTVTGSYLGLTRKTDQGGKVSFRLPEGDYKFRADHVGSQYWSGEETLTAHAINPITLSTGGGSFTVTAFKGAGEPLSSAKCYVFGAENNYLGLFGATDANGQVFFNLANGTYRFRMDHLGYQFWSGVAIVPGALSAEMDILHEQVQVHVETGSEAAPGVRVYLFSGNGVYLGLYQETDQAGNVMFELPIDKGFQFRADILGNQYWSEVANIEAYKPNLVAIDAGGGKWQVALRKGPGMPMEGIKTSLFSGSGAYLGLSRTTDGSGLAAFDVPQGSFKVRADYMGYPFWSETTQVTGDTDTDLTIPHAPVEIAVYGLFQNVEMPLPEVKVYLFTATDTYLGVSQKTDGDGKVHFSLPSRDYKVRVDYLDQKYWSDLFNGQNASVPIPMADVEITITGGGFPQAGQKVYAYSSTTAYLGLSQTSDEQGKVCFRLPAGSYRFRVDHQGNQYWSEEEALEPDQVNPVVISTGGGSFTFTIEKSSGVPLAGARCYVFNSAGAYAGMLGATNEQGEALFNLAQGTFKLRADHLGYQFWSPPYDTSTILSGVLNLGEQDVAVTVRGSYQGLEPIQGVKVYLFSPSGTYLGQVRVTGEDGSSVFTLPDREYKVRADYLGEQFWSSVFRRQDMTVTVNHGQVEIHVHRSAANVENAKVYLFSQEGAYLGQYEYTDETGRARFLLPDRSYKFRVDEGADQIWTPLVIIQPGVVNTVGLDLD